MRITKNVIIAVIVIFFIILAALLYKKTAEPFQTTDPLNTTVPEGSMDLTAYFGTLTADQLVEYSNIYRDYSDGGSATDYLTSLNQFVNTYPPTSPQTSKSIFNLIIQNDIDLNTNTNINDGGFSPTQKTEIQNAYEKYTFDLTKTMPSLMQEAPMQEPPMQEPPMQEAPMQQLQQAPMQQLQQAPMQQLQQTPMQEPQPLQNIGSSSSSSSSSSSMKPFILPPTQPPTNNIGSSSSSSRLTGSYNSVIDRPATVSELIDFQARLQAEMTRLNASGSTDEVTRARITNLRKISGMIQGILDKVNDKTLPENQIPIMKSSVDAAFTALKSNSPLPNIFVGTQLDSFIKNLLPDNLANDPEVTATIAEYIQSMSNNLSWNFGVKYTSKTEQDMAKYYNNAASQGNADVTDLNLSMAGGAAGHQPANFGSNSRITDPHANTPQEACRGPANFDWQKRSKEICSALKSRGENVEDYGCMPDGVNVGSNFSYRGYAHMICTRVAANYDTGLGGLVGCPPLDWPGWRK